MGEPDLTDLVNEAEQLVNEIEGTGDLPRIDRSLRQVLEASQDLWSRLTVSGAQDVQANILLGTKGLDLPQITQKLQTLSSQRTFEPLDPVPITDIPSFLKNERENAVLQLIVATNQTTFKDVEDAAMTEVHKDWNKYKDNLMNSLLGYSKQIIDVPQRLESWVGHERASSGAPGALGQVETAYARALTHFYCPPDPTNASNAPLIDVFSQVALTFNNQKLSEMWKMLKCMSQLTMVGDEDPLRARGSSHIQEKMTHLALSYLEQRYKAYMTTVISSNLNIAKRGGIPGTYTLVRGFVGVHVTQTSGLEDIKLDGLHLWPLVYYCLRCGDVSAALNCVKLAGVGFEEMVATLEDLKESVNKRLSLRSEMQVKSTYRRLVSTSNDSYKRAVYCVLGACDVHDEHKEVVTSADDFLWLKLSQVRPEAKETLPDHLHYTLLQSLVIDQYGESYYKAWEQPHVYFQVLTLTGQWEAAIDFLAHSDKFATDAVHMAIALHQLGLLALPATLTSPLLVIDEADKAPMRRLNLLRLVLLHTHKFEKTEPKQALPYYYSLRELENEGVNCFVSCVSDLVMETKEYDLLLGRLLEDNTRLPGLLDSYPTSRIPVKTIIEHVAQSTEEKGLYEDAVQLYDLCGNHEKVVYLLSMLLGKVAGVRGGGPHRATVAQLAQSVATRYHGSRLNCAPQSLSTFYLMINLLSFFDLYHSNQYNKALEVIQETRLLPSSTDEFDEKVNNFKLLEECIAQNSPEVLLAVMNIYYQQYLQTQGDLNSTKLEDVVRTKKLDFLRERARLITSFAGTIPYKMPGGVNSKLVQIEILMN